MVALISKDCASLRISPGTNQLNTGGFCPSVASKDRTSQEAPPGVTVGSGVGVALGVGVAVGAGDAVGSGVAVGLGFGRQY